MGPGKLIPSLLWSRSELLGRALGAWLNDGWTVGATLGNVQVVALV